MTITLPLEPQDEARLIAAAKAKGISAGELVRSALDSILAGASANSVIELPQPAMGSALVAAMQASPCREIDLDSSRGRMPVRDIVF